MRKILFLIIFTILIICSSVSYSQTNFKQESEVVHQDTVIDVVGYFSKNDTLIYSIYHSNWKLSPSDSITVADVYKKVRLTVTDSTSKGYKMDFTFLDFKGDSITVYSILNKKQKFLNAIVKRFNKKMVGTTIHFETDELGTITKINDLGKIKRQVYSLFKESMKEILQMPEFVALKKEIDIDIKKMTKYFDSEKLVDDYLEDLRLLFLCHGNRYIFGKSHSHEDASETNYENDTYYTVTFDSSNNTYSITTQIINYIPASEIEYLLSGLVEYMDNDIMTESFNEDFDIPKNENMIYDSYINSNFLPSGWPYKIIHQNSTTFCDHGRLSLKYIYLDYINY